MFEEQLSHITPEQAIAIPYSKIAESLNAITLKIAENDDLDGMETLGGVLGVLSASFLLLLKKLEAQENV